MATTSNARNVMLASDSPRTLPVTLPSTYNTSGDHSGTWNSLGQTVHRNDQVSLSATGALLNAGGGFLSSLDDVGGNYLGNWSGLSELVHRNSQISLSSSGSLVNAGGGTITALPYSSTTGGPPTNADNTQTRLESAATSITVNSGNLFEVFGSGSAGVFIGSGGLVGRDSGGSTTFAISASSGAVDVRGDIFGGSNIDITGQGRFNGATSSGGFTGAVLGNSSFGLSYGVVGFSSSAAGVVGSTSGGASGVVGQTSGSGAAVVGVHTSGGTALQISSGTFVTFSSAFVDRLYADRALSADSVLGSNVSGTVASATNASNATNSSNTSAMSGIAASGWCRIMVTDSGSASASSSGFVFQSTVTGVRTRATGGRNFVVEEFSDEALKTNESPETLGLDFILGLEPVTYERQDSPGITYHGIGARKTRAHLEGLRKQKRGDSLGRTLPDGVESSSTIGLIGPLIKAVQELSREVETLKRSNGV